MYSVLVVLLIQKHVDINSPFYREFPTMPVDEVDDLFSVSSVSHKPGINFASYFPTEYVLLFFFLYN